MNKTQIFFRKYSSTILTVISSIGVITTTVLAVKATPKAIELLNKEKEDNNELTKKEIIKIAWKPYIPTFISGFSTIACIFGANYLNLKSQASLMSAYAFLNNSYKELSQNSGKESLNELAKSKFDQDIVQDESKKLFFDYQSMRYFESTIEDVLRAENELNREFAATGYVSINDFYRSLNIPLIEYGDYIGWSSEGNYYELTFEHERFQLDDGLECCMIIMDYPTPI